MELNVYIRVLLRSAAADPAARARCPAAAVRTGGSGHVTAGGGQVVRCASAVDRGVFHYCPFKNFT